VRWGLHRANRRSRTETIMRVYHKALEMNRMLAKVAPAIARFDRDLLRQLKRASMSVPLNIGEGLGQRAGHREERFHSALASARVRVFTLMEPLRWRAFQPHGAS
jgi:hypothetical protein